jgi:hypothetical protein
MQENNNKKNDTIFNFLLFYDKRIFFLFSFLLVIHGLIHLLGFIVYLQIGEIEDLPFKTTILFELIDLGNNGIRIFGIIWLMVTVAYLLVIIAFIIQKKPNLYKWLYLVTIFSLIITFLDFTVAFRGTLFNLLVLVILLLDYDTVQENVTKIKGIRINNLIK